MDPRTTDTPMEEANHRHPGFAAPRCSKLPTRNPVLMALQESVGSMGRPLDLLLAPIRCRRPWSRCCLIPPNASVLTTVTGDNYAPSATPYSVTALYRSTFTFHCLRRDCTGTRVVEGIGKMVVTAVGVNSAKGVIFNLLGLTCNSVSRTAPLVPSDLVYLDDRVSSLSRPTATATFVYFV